MAPRLTPCEPSQPATNSQVSSCRPTRVRVGDGGALAVDTRERYVLRAVDHRQTAFHRGVIQVFHDLGLTVYRNGAAAGERAEVDVQQLAAGGQVRACVRQSLALHARAEAELDHEIGGDLLEHARPHATFHVVAFATFEHHAADAGAFATFEHHAADAGAMKQVCEEHAGGARPDDGNLGICHFRGKYRPAVAVAESAR